VDTGAAFSFLKERLARSISPERVGGLAPNVVIVIYLVIRLIRRRARQP
jgi:uncharacterized membrane protein (DUF2068 family)